MNVSVEVVFEPPSEISWVSISNNHRWKQPIAWTCQSYSFEEMGPWAALRRVFHRETSELRKQKKQKYGNYFVVFREKKNIEPL